MIRLSTGFYLLIFCMILCGSCSDNSEMELSTCIDGIQNGEEEGIDCGGPCPPCLTKIEVPDTGYESPKSYEGYSLVWSDEFDGKGLDLSKWTFHLGDGCPNLCFWGNNELQYYTDSPKNIFLQNGYLAINAIQETINGYSYSSSRIHTDNIFEFKYGRIDIRAAMPSATGTWVALWLLNKNYSIQQPGVKWPSGGEIDIMEFLGEDPTEILGTAHFGTDFPANHRFISKHYQTKTQPFDKSFYVFSIIWEKDRIQWLINDEVYHEITPSDTAARGQPYPFNDEFFLIMNLSVGGNLPAPPIIDDYPSSVIIDYVRIFQK